MMRDQKMGRESRFYFSASIIEFGKRLLVTNSVCDSKFGGIHFNFFSFSRSVRKLN